MELNLQSAVNVMFSGIHICFHNCACAPINSSYKWIRYFSSGFCVFSSYFLNYLLLLIHDYYQPTTATSSSQACSRLCLAATVSTCADQQFWTHSHRICEAQILGTV